MSDTINNQNQVVDDTTTQTQTSATDTSTKGPVQTEKMFTQADIDRAVTQAIKTREANMREELKDFYKKEALKENEADADKKAQKIISDFEDKMRERERQANIREAEVELKNAGFSEEEIKFYVADVTHDRDASIARISKICDFEKQRNDAIKQKYIESLAGQVGNHLQTGSAEANSLQAEYDKAKKDGNMPYCSYIQRQAMEKGIDLKEI